MRWVAETAVAVALVNCALAGAARADDDAHWLTDTQSNCSLFDANAKAGDSVSWSGACKDGLADGQGTAVFTNNGKQFESFTGSFAKGVAQDGPVTVSWGNGWHYQGNEVAGQFSGAGVLVNQAKDRFEGTWVKGKMNGEGSLIRADGERYEGAWKDDLPNGPGTLTRADGQVLKGTFHDGKLEAVALDSPKKQEAKKEPPEARAFAGVSGKILTSVDGSRIALTLIEGGIERQITAMGAQPKKTTFTFMTDRLGTVVEDGGEAAGANVTGFFRLTDNGVEVRYADGRSEMLTATPDGGVMMRRTAVSGAVTCRSWYPQGHSFSEADKKQALAEYAAKLGLGPEPKESCQAVAAAGTQPAPPIHPAETKPHERPARLKPTSYSPPPSRKPAKLASLMPVTVKDSVVHTIDAMDASPPVVMTALPGSQKITPAGQHDASSCLKVESDGNHWGFRNSCAFPVQFAYCMWRGSEPLAGCDANSGHGISGSVAANGTAMLTTDTRFGGKQESHDFRWVACDGGAGEVVAHLDHADPPSGRCERASVASTRH